MPTGLAQVGTKLALVVGAWSVVPTACQSPAPAPATSGNALAKFRRWAQRPGIGTDNWMCGTSSSACSNRAP